MIMPEKGNVLVKIIESEVKFVTNKDEKEKTGVSLAIRGWTLDGKFRDNLNLRVIHSMYDGLPVNYNGEKYMILKSTEIRGTIPNEEV